MIVNISGTFSKDQRPNNGLDAIAEQINGNRLQRIAVVGIIAFHGHHDVVGRPEYISVHFEALEPTAGDADEQTRQILDQIRKGRGLGQVELTLFDEPPAAREATVSAAVADRDPTAGPWPGDPDYQAPTEAAEDNGPTSERTPDVWLEDGSSGNAAAPKPRRRKPASPPDGE